MKKTLTQLLLQLGWSHSYASNPEITGVTHDSRMVQPGFIFVAIAGIASTNRAALDGHDYIAKALERGAVAVVGTRALDLGAIPYLQVNDDRAALGDVAAAFWDFPAQKLKTIGITGSKGKTTTAVLTHHLLEQAGLVAGRVSTVGICLQRQNWRLPGHFTTPEAPQVQELLARFVAAGASHAVLEVSSHALALERVRGIAFDGAIWVNFSPDDHLDFHESAERYFAAKQKLLEQSHLRIINRDDGWSKRLPAFDNTIFYGAGGQWQINSLIEQATGLQLRVDSPLGIFDVELPMLGGFNAHNALAAMAAVVAVSDLDVAALQAGCASFPGVPGRMQLVPVPGWPDCPVRLINDFAHTEMSLRTVLKTLRPSTVGRLVVVVGAAGERDVARRGGIARAVGELADFVIFTEEDSRSEPVEQILKAITDVHYDYGGYYYLEPDRRLAIRYAIWQAEAGDTIVFAGKGHEWTLERANEVLDWDENAEIQAAALEAWKK
jgi:UDP-N-acetylmuramoyl-L-alanyl-D-glutamate--2,6-diaminopimelate ligase